MDKTIKKFVDQALTPGTALNEKALEQVAHMVEDTDVRVPVTDDLLKVYFRQAAKEVARDAYRNRHKH